MPVVAQLSRVTKHYGDVVALDDVSLAVEAGEVVAVLGPNGAGKTTALSILLGLRRADSGEVSLLGGDPALPATRSGVGVTLQEMDFPAHLRVREVVELIRAHYPAPEDADSLLTQFELTDVSHRQTGGLSGGERRRLAVALAFVGRPSLVFLDEPTAGLDVESRHRLWATLGAFLAGGGTLVLTTHYLEEAEALANRVVMLANGGVAADGSVTSIISQVGLKVVRFKGKVPEQLPAVARIQHYGEAVTLWTRDADATVKALVQKNIPFHDLEVRASSLEEAFLVITEHNLPPPEATQEENR